MDHRVMLAILLGVGLGTTGLHAQRSSAVVEGAPSSDKTVFGVFCGTTPCDRSIRQLLGIATNAEAEVMEWKLTLYQHLKTAPARYELRCEYGLTIPGKPGVAKGIKSLERQGTWMFAKGATSNPDALVYELKGAVSLVQVDTNIVHLMNADRTLMIGNGGWSYTLNRTGRSQEDPDPTAAPSEPPASYRISPVATGPTVFGVFEGRTPGQGIARELKIPVTADCNKAKWRVTLYQNPETLEATTFKVEGSLFRREPREGNWTIVRGTQKDANAIVYRLKPSKTGPALFLLKGDDNVLFFLNQNQSPLVGDCRLSYTLNRRSAL